MLKYHVLPILFIVQNSLLGQELAKIYAVTDCKDGFSTLYYEVDSILAEVFTSSFLVKYTPKGFYNFTFKESYHYSGKMENISPGNYDVYIHVYSYGLDMFGIEIEKDACKNDNNKNQVITYGYWKTAHFLNKD